MKIKKGTQNKTQKNIKEENIDIDENIIPITIKNHNEFITSTVTKRNKPF